jgi:hypothetical protein
MGRKSFGSSPPCDRKRDLTKPFDFPRGHLFLHPSGRPTIDFAVALPGLRSPEWIIRNRKRRTCKIGFEPLPDSLPVERSLEPHKNGTSARSFFSKPPFRFPKVRPAHSTNAAECHSCPNTFRENRLEKFISVGNGTSPPLEGIQGFGIIFSSLNDRI